MSEMYSNFILFFVRYISIVNIFIDYQNTRVFGIFCKSILSNVILLKIIYI